MTVSPQDCGRYRRGCRAAHAHRLCHSIKRPWLSTRELAQLLDEHRFSIRNWRRAGPFPHTIKTEGGQYRHAREDVVRLLRARIPYNSRGFDYAATRQRLTADVVLSPLGEAGAIAALREQGCTWASIAAVLGVSGSTVGRRAAS